MSYSHTPPAPLSDQQGRTLVTLSRRSIGERLRQASIVTGTTAATPVQDLDLNDPIFTEHRGTFVTLKINGQLRGCIGSLAAAEPLLVNIPRNAVNAAFHDPRFKPLSAAELPLVDIEVSILTEPRPLTYDGADDLLAKLRANVDGVIIRQGSASATFLPQVWKQLPRPADFLTHLCLKAGLPGRAWQSGNLEVRIYQVQYFAEKD